MDFFSIDVETANADYSSICQIGIAEFKNGVLVDKWVSLVNPETHFDDMNYEIHGIGPDEVEDAPKFNELYSDLYDKLKGSIVVHHMPFDRVAMNRVCIKYDIKSIDVRWLDSARIVKRVWSQFSKKGYGLKNVSNFLNIDFKHHDALEDAIAAGKVIVAASNESNLNIDELLVRVEQPVDPNYSSYAKSLNFEPNENGKLFGEHVVFTGELSMPRKDIAQIAANIGCTVKDSVTKKTTILVIGIQDESKLNGYTKSSKHRKAEEMISNGANITILSEQDFVSIYED